MEIGHFYYIEDQYFIDFPDNYLMQNKETAELIRRITQSMQK